MYSYIVIYIVLYIVTNEENTLLVSNGHITSTHKPHHLYEPQAIELIMRKTGKKF